MSFNNFSLFEKLKFYPFVMLRDNEYYRGITSGFVHADYMHLFFNMLTLFFFGKYAESIFSPSYIYILFYLSALVVSGLPEYFKNNKNPYYTAVGASGAVSAVVFSLVLFNPWGTIYVYFIPVPFILYAFLFLGYSYYMSKKNMDNIGHTAHLYGAIFGICATVAYRPDAINIFLSQIFKF
jgi:membrane associated rhomboid family serine protease